MGLFDRIKRACGGSEKETEVTQSEQKYDQGLAKSRKTFGERLNALFANFRSVDEDFFDDLEETLIGADVGFDMAVEITDELREAVKLQNVKEPTEVAQTIVQKLVDRYEQD